MRNFRTYQCSRNRSCYDLSKSKKQICTPFIKESSLLDDIILFPMLIILLLLPLLIVTLDILYLQSSKATGSKVSNEIKALCFYFLLYASGISFLSHKNFDNNLFCSMNFQENLCSRVNKMTKHYSAFSSKDDRPIVTSSPCQFKVDQNLIGKDLEQNNYRISHCETIISSR